MSLESPGLTVGIALAAGATAQIVARHLRIPGIVLLLGLGVLLGPEVANVVRPQLLGNGLNTLVGLAVAVILFEGGLNLNIRRLRREGKVIRRLVTLGALVTAVGGALAARWLMGWDWRMSFLFGTLVIVTGPTVITPLLRRIRVQRNVRTVLEAEGVLIDPIGAIIAIVALEFAITPTTGVSVGTALVDLTSRLGFGIAAGLGCGVALGLVLRLERVIPEGLQNIFVLALVLAMYAGSNAILEESGIMTVTVAGLVVGNMRTHIHAELQEFQEQLTVLAIGMLFVLLAADVRVAEVVALGWMGVAAVVVLMFVVRPVNVAVSTLGSRLGWRERAFMCWLAPRGIVAAAVASLFAQDLAHQGFTGGEELRALVFLVIAVTVIVQGLPGALVAALLGIRLRANAGYVIVGANPVGRALARALTEGGEEVLLIDLNPQATLEAEREGFRAMLGNVNSERTLIRADVESRRGAIGATSSEGVNLLFARRVRELFKVPETYVTLKRGRPGVQEPQVFEAGAQVLFGGPIDLELWSHRVRNSTADVQVWTYDGPARRLMETEEDGLPDNALLPLAFNRRGRVIPMDDTVRFRAGDRLTVLVYRDLDERVAAWFRATGWTPGEAEAGGAEPGTGAEPAELPA